MALRIDRSDRIKAWLLSMPAFLLYSAVLIYPIIQVFRMSFYAWNGIPASPMRFVGFNNYKAFLTDARFLIALKILVLNLKLLKVKLLFCPIQ